MPGPSQEMVSTPWGMHIIGGVAANALHYEFMSFYHVPQARKGTLLYLQGLDLDLSLAEHETSKIVMSSMTTRRMESFQSSEL